MSVLRLFESIVCARVSDMDSTTVRSQFRALSRVRAWIDAREAELAARLIDLTPDGSTAVAGIDVQGNARTTNRQTRALLERSRALQQLPEFSTALREGKVTSAHVDEVAEALRKTGKESHAVLAHEGVLVQSALRLPHDQFAQQVKKLVQRLNASAAADESERQRRSTYLKSWTDSSGMIHLRGAFDAERGAVLLGRIENEMERQFHSGGSVNPEDVIGVSPNDHRRAMALLNLVGAGVQGLSTDGHGSTDVVAVAPAGSRSHVNAEISVVIDLETLRNGLHQSGVCRTTRGADLPVETVRRLACQAQIIPIVLNGAGVPIDVGRQNRLATARQRKLIHAMYRTCAAPGCEVGITHCVPHHIDYWENGGRTDDDNLVPLCSRHHHAVHEGGWSLLLDADRALHVTFPDGRKTSRPLERNLEGSLGRDSVLA